MRNEPFITEADIEKLKTSDDRWRAVDLAIKVDEELRNSLALNLVLEAASRHAAYAIEQLVYVSPADTPKIIELQAKVQCARFITDTLQSVRLMGIKAQTSLEDDNNEGSL